MSAAVLALLLLAAPADPAADLWAKLLDPSISTAERVKLAEGANAVLTPEYIPKVAALQVAIDNGTGRGDMRVILEHVKIPTRDADPYALVRELPCGTYFEGQVILETLRHFPMNAETYGVVRNFVMPREAEFFPRGLPRWWTFAGYDDWHAAQAFIIESSAPHESDGRMVFSEPIATISERMYELERMLVRVRPFPANAFLALADRIANERTEHACFLAGDAARLLKSVDQPPFGEEGMHTAEQCAARVEQFRDWLSEHRGELEGAAGQEVAAVEDARKRMQRVTLCRP